jgi:hypothetical protein
MKRSVCHLLGVLAASAAVALPASAITIDGDFSDWTNVPVIATDPADNAGSIDLRTLQVANDEDFVYFRYTLEESVNPQGGAGIYLAIDEDNNVATGFDPFSLGVVGAEASWQNDFGFEQDTGNFNTGNGITNATYAAAPYNAATLSVEISVPRSAGHAVNGDPIFPGDGQTIRVAFWTEEGADDIMGGAYTILVREPEFLTGTVTQVSALSFNSQSGITYRLEYNSDLLNTNWVFTGYQTVGSGGLQYMYDPAGFATAKVYRIVVP